MEKGGFGSSGYAVPGRDSAGKQLPVFEQAQRAKRAAGGDSRARAGAAVVRDRFAGGGLPDGQTWVPRGFFTFYGDLDAAGGGAGVQGLAAGGTFEPLYARVAAVPGALH